MGKLRGQAGNGKTTQRSAKASLWLRPLSWRVTGRRPRAPSAGRGWNQKGTRLRQGQRREREAGSSLPPASQSPTCGSHWPNLPQASWPEGLGNVAHGVSPSTGEGHAMDLSQQDASWPGLLKSRNWFALPTPTDGGGYRLPDRWNLVAISIYFIERGWASFLVRHRLNPHLQDLGRGIDGDRAGRGKPAKLPASPATGGPLRDIHQTDSQGER